MGVVDDCGRPMFYNTIPTYVGRGPDDASKRMGAAISNAITGAGLQAGDVAGVGLGSPGTMDIPAGKLVVPANLKGWEHFPLRDRVAHYAGMPVTFANDATAAAFGELWVGSGKAFHSMVLLTLGTGIGCGIIIGDLLLDGEHSHGGEFGHHIIDSADNVRALWLRSVGTSRPTPAPPPLPSGRGNCWTRVRVLYQSAGSRSGIGGQVGGRRSGVRR